MMRLHGFLGLLLTTVIAASCEPAYVPTVAPEDASFGISCAATCGIEGREKGLLVDVRFYRSYSRQFAVCCPQRAALLAQLQTINDFWCDGLDVPDKPIGDLVVGTTDSEASGKRGATLEQGEGYVAFNCGEWLTELIAELKKTTCCA